MESEPQTEDVLLVDAPQLLRALVFLRAPFSDRLATLEFNGKELIIFDGSNHARAEASGSWSGMIACHLFDLWDVLAFDCIDKITTTLHISGNRIKAGEMAVWGRATVGGNWPTDDDDEEW